MDTDNAKVNAKIDQWERKLLDLSLRNSLLNMKIKGSMIPVFAHSPALLEDKLYEETDFFIKPRNEEKSTKKEEQKTADQAASEPAAEPEKSGKQTIPAKEYDLENICDLDGFDQLITENFEKKKLFSSLTKSELETSIKKLYRSAKVALEENGANTLYIALGVMKWFDKGGSTPHYAPLVLIPVDLVRKSFALGYVIRRRDEEPIVNITLLEKLKQDFGIVTDVKEIFVSDESGVDIDKVIENFRGIIAGQDGWDIYNSCVIGIFSFTNFVMWNDLRARRDKIGENKIVKSLLEGKLCWEAKDMVVPNTIDEEDCFLPITADSSQLYAIKRATAGDSFVLHGPPGTGKSQTITSMIADMLAHGKTVLFAAEKKAALDVVYSRLDKIGLGSFCLELHSNKAKKSAFLGKLREAVELRQKTGSGDYNKMLNELASTRHELDKYCAALHDDRKCGFSLYELISIYTVNSQAPDVAPFDAHFKDTVNEDTYRNCEASLESLISAGRALGDIGCLASIRTSEYSQKLKSDMPVVAADLKAKTAALEENYGKVCAAVTGVGVMVPGLGDKTFGSVRKAVGISNAMLSSFSIPAKICAADDYEAVLRAIEEYQAQKKLRDARNAEILPAYKPEIFNLDLESISNELREAMSKSSLFKSMAVSKVAKKIEPYRAIPSKDEHLETTLAIAIEAKNASNSCEKIYSERLASYIDRAVLDDETKAQAVITAARTHLGKIDEYDRTGVLRKTYAANPSYTQIWSGFNQAYVAFDEPHSVLEDNIGIKAVHDAETFEDQYWTADDIINNMEHLRDRVMFNQALGDSRSKLLANVVNAYVSSQITEEELIPAFKKAFAKLFITEIIDSDDTLRNFSGKIFEERVAKYKKLNDDFMKMTRQEIYLRVAANLPDLAVEATKGSALGILQHAIKSNGRGVSIRTLFSQIPDLILKLCPCVLMSPISVAQYLEPGVLKFDTVLFDEASQLPTCKAVGVIARADNAIIVGDPNQMPPTSFFQSANFDEENYEIEDLESILDDCLALNMPGTHLLWHYRSKHESLITYSNRAFYDNRLYTFPSSNDLERKVSFVPCEGTFDRGKTRTNRGEAEAVVEEIIRRIKSDPGKSIGVVTFNISQQDLIDDLLSDRCKKEPELEQALFGSEEPVFIKNLENVQGDERDIILFSVGYGTDEEGKIYMNFGPLSQDGGWRRLNVAVTRARYEMVVFSSLEPEQIKITADTARGVAAFRSFLEYAQGRTVWENSATTVSEAPVIDRFADYTGVVDGICNELEKAGYKTSKNVGSSEYKVDIGVVDPRDESRYCLGLLLDGKFYKENKTTSGREIYQENVLTGLGWNTMRVWSVDWWENRTRVVDEIVARITAVTAGKDEPEVTVTEEPEPQPETPSEEPVVTSEDPVEESAPEPVSDEEGKKKLNPPGEGNT
ncbi:Part of AAA domain-containing protein [Ruminococcaceae bacterium YRB3002]|nr:Part of AAA domain-containing protein [Ruminococcaceae bacterium YRB3002]